MPNNIDKVQVNNQEVSGFLGTSYRENFEYIKVTTDSDGVILEAVKPDGTKYISQNLQVDGDIINQKLQEIKDTVSFFKSTEDIEWADVKTDSSGNIIEGIKRNGKVYISDIENKDIDLLLKHVETDYIKANEIRTIESLGIPETVFSTHSEVADTMDNISMGYNQVIKISDNLYYMYYDTCGSDCGFNEYEGIVYSNTYGGFGFRFAYSTDGLNWIKGYPPNITPPDIDSINTPALTGLTPEEINRIKYNPIAIFLNNNTMVGAGSACVIKAYWDKDYPFRAITSDGSMYMYKSRDGVVFTDRKLIDDTWRDCQPTAIVRGNTIKIYNRHRPASGRRIAVLYCDLEGNVLSPSRYLFGNDDMYQSSGGMLDERRDILFPTRFKQTTAKPYDVEGINCYIVDGNKVLPIDIDENVFTENGRFKSLYVHNGGLIEIKKDNIIKQYIYYSCSERCHDENNGLPLKYDTISDFPSTGEANTLYIDKFTGKTYKWMSSSYVESYPGDYVVEIRRIEVIFGEDLYVNK